MDRLISEQDVLDVINEAIRLGRFYSGKEQTIAEIKAISSAEPNITWVTGADGAKVAFKDVPVDKVVKICEILGEGGGE